jgi:hypothetical protein
MGVVEPLGSIILVIRVRVLFSILSMVQGTVF